MNSFEDAGTHDPPERPRYRVPVGLPLKGEGRRQGAVISVLLHALIIALIILPVFYGHTIIEKIEQGAGGAGPSGGGGGGHAGESGYRETLRFVKVAPTQIPTPTSLPVIPPPVIPKVAQPIPQPVPPPVATPVKAPESAVEPVVTQAVSSATGNGNGSGKDGTNGNGPGSGGGVGSGTGTGRGSGVGPGTGGGTQANYPPSPKEFFLPPLPPPASVRGFKFIAEFDVDSTGRVLDYKFTETRDGGYNERLKSVLKSMRFVPGHTPDGIPVRMKAQIGYEF